MLRLSGESFPQSALQGTQVGWRSPCGWVNPRAVPWGVLEGQPQLLQHVPWAQRRLRPLLDELVAAQRRGARDGARHGEHRPPLLERGVGRDDRPRVRRRLDHDGDAGEARDQAVASRERVGVRPLARRELGHETPCRDHALVQRPVRRWVDHSEAVAQDAHRPAAGVERRGVRDGINPPSHPAHDHRAPGAPAATPAASSRAASAPYAVWLRLPTIAAAGWDSNRTSPQTYRSAGGSGTSARSWGKPGSPGMSRAAPRRSSVSRMVRPAAADVPRIAEAAAGVNPGSAAMAPWAACNAPVALSNAATRVRSRTAPIPGTCASAG